MPKQHDLARLVSDEVMEALNHGAVHIAPFAEAFVSKHRDLLEERGQELALREIRNMVRRSCKRAIEQTAQPIFPEFGDALPLSIAVPRGSNDEDPYYISLTRASMRELCASVQMLTGQIEADTRKRDTLRNLVRECEALGAVPEDIVSEVVRRPRAA